MSANENQRNPSAQFLELGKATPPHSSTQWVRQPQIHPHREHQSYSGVSTASRITTKVLAPLGAALEGGLVITPDNLIGDVRVRLRWQRAAKSTAKNGKSYNNTYCHVFRITNGKISEGHRDLDTEAVTSVFGK